MFYGSVSHNYLFFQQTMVQRSWNKWTLTTKSENSWLNFHEVKTTKLVMEQPV